MKTRIISLILPFLMCLTLCACDDEPNVPASIVDAGADSEEYVYTGNGSAWCSALFEHPATSYNNDLALVAAEMSEAAEDMTGDGIKNLYSSYGIYADAIGCYGPDGDLLSDRTFGGGAFSIGQDTLTINGVNTTILVITARGTKNILEGIGDVFKGGENVFLNTKVWHNVYEFEEQIWDGLNEYLTMYPALLSKDDLKILVVGHSLGGAAANMFGARLVAGIGSSEWWGSKVTKDDIYVYTFGAIKVLTTEDNVTTGYENIHNVYNYYDSYGPNGNQKGTNASSLNAKFGHTELYYLPYQENGTTILHSCNSHLMPNYKDALEQFKSDSGFIKLACEEQTILSPADPNGGVVTTPEIQAPTDPPAEYEDAPVVDSFTIEGSWKSVGSYGFGQAQPGAIVAFDGTHCNFFSPYDTYAFYQDNGQWKLDCTSFLFSETLTFRVEIIDGDSINVYYGSNCTELRRTG